MSRGEEQVGGHGGSMVVEGSRLLKACLEPELDFYKRLENESLADYAPKFHGTVTKEGKEFLVLENLTEGMEDPVVMDIKMGTTTFVEDADDLDTKRMDLLQKMIKVDPNAPSESQRETGISKREYMLFREGISSTTSLGFRIEGIKHIHADDTSKTEIDFKKVKSPEQVLEALKVFVSFRPQVAAEFKKLLAELEQILRGSKLFVSHRATGSSILFLYDVKSAAVKLRMIDFAKTLPSGKHVSHELGEDSGDGYFYGLGKLVDIWTLLA
eukprot:CAMPEP_0184742530 /NCGR_PEP_ID=MMETSP0315-20130426/5465_1 /TAXON_ID=101924 /ORGANISM="Rhodosorus marinus, Strain UTEX LB 2760" /LENGTH=269 /DNA_ID=CAMNT_0027213377 /DNA_START=99 /DNA_END=911 /DNA_ORIENTATION=+